MKSTTKEDHKNNMGLKITNNLGRKYNFTKVKRFKYLGVTIAYHGEEKIIHSRMDNRMRKNP